MSNVLMSNLLKTSLFVITMLATASGLPALASQQSLDRFFTDVKTLRADFEQRVVDESGMLLEQSTGVFYLSRPGRFRWDYRSEDPAIPLGQQIIADGDHIYMYDPDLEQVTRRSLQDALGQVPSLLLVQTGAQIEKHFQLTDFGLTDGLSWIALKPLDEDAGYQQLMIGFAEEQIQQIMLLDGLGNETRLRLSTVEENIGLPSTQFQFEPPAGTDVLVQ